jgi:hypothetical protein
MTLDELREELRARGVRVWREAEKLRYDGPQGSVTPALLDELREHRSGLLASLPDASGVRLRDLVPVPRRDAAIQVPVSFGQQRLWFLDRLQGSSAEFNLPDVLHLRGELDVAALDRALNGIVRRHESLRTRFVEVDGEPMQVVDPELRVSLPVRDLAHLDERARAEAVAEAKETARQMVFDLSTGPLLRFLLLRLGPAEHVLLRNFHHIVSDGWSTGVLNREMEALYAAFKSGQEDPLPPLALQYPDYSAWQRQRLSGAALGKKIAYWRDQLAGARPLEIPTDRPRPATQSFRAGCQRFDLGAGLTARMDDFNRREAVTPFMTLMTAFGIVMARHSGQRDIVV